MRDMKVIDKDGGWFVNTALFRFVDPTHGEGKEVIFEPGVPTKVKETEWMKSQALIVACPDPFESDEPIPTVIVPSDSTVVPKDEETGVPTPSAAPGIQGTAADLKARKK